MLSNRGLAKSVNGSAEKRGVNPLSEGEIQLNLSES